MTEEEREAEYQWALRMAALEDEFGPIVPGGAVGGVGARARRAAEGKRSASMRARTNVRYLARAVPLPNEHEA